MELRGYGRTKSRTFTSNIALMPYDVVLISGMLMVITISLAREILPLL